MTLKIRLHTMVLTLATLMLILFTNAVAIAKDIPIDNNVINSTIKNSASQNGERISVPGGPGYVMVSAHDFIPATMTTQWAYDGGIELFNPGSLQETYYAPVHLPHLATVNKVVLFYYDSVAEDLQLNFRRVEAGFASVGLMTEIMPTGDSGYSSASTTSIDYAQIDLANYSYALTLTLPGGAAKYLTLMQVRIDYDYSTFLPTVLK